MTLDKIAMFNLLPIKMHYSPQSLANIISMKDLSNVKGVKIRMDSTVKKAIVVEYRDTILTFNQCSDGLYYFDTSDNFSNVEFAPYSPFSTSTNAPSTSSVCTNSTNSTHHQHTNINKPTNFLQSVNSNREFFTRAEIEGADKSRQIQQQIGWPSTPAFKKILEKNLLLNCPITVEDVQRAEYIYGPAVPLIKGTMTRALPPKYKVKRINIPSHIIDRLQHLETYVDFMFVNGIPFLVSKTGKIDFLGVVPCSSRSASTIIHGLKAINKQHTSRGFTIDITWGDNEFGKEKVKNDMLPVDIKTVPAGAHVGKIEHAIRRIKEKSRKVE